MLVATVKLARIGKITSKCVLQVSLQRPALSTCPADKRQERAIISRVAASLQPLRKQQNPVHLAHKTGLCSPASVRHLQQLLGWQVLNTNLELVGTVIEVIPQTCGVAGSSPVLRIESCTCQGSRQHKQAAGLEGEVQHLVPWVPAIIQGIRPADSIIVIAPPAGLLDLGRRHQLARQLGPELEAYGSAPGGSMAERLGQRFMPTRKRLKAAGREDLIRLVTKAGGFMHVAQCLGLRSCRRPQGFWDDLNNLDRELSIFVAGMWTSLEAADGTYYYNQVTGKQQWEEPQPPQSIPIDDAGTVIFAEEESQRVMPSRSTVLAAGRFDLHHGIMYQGGYTSVAQQLARPATWPKHKKYASIRELAKALQAFISEQELEPHVFPSASILRAADRLDLQKGIEEHGGLFALQPKIRLATTRGPGWPDVATAAKELRNVAVKIGSRMSDSAELRMPTMQQLRDAGRKDLVYAAQKFGYNEIATAARLVPAKRRRKVAGQCL